MRAGWCLLRCTAVVELAADPTPTPDPAYRSTPEPNPMNAPALRIRPQMIEKQINELKKLWGNKRQFLFQALNLAMIVFSALMIWKVMVPRCRVVSEVKISSTFAAALEIPSHHFSAPLFPGPIQGLMFVTKSESPVVVVLSGSMEPAFQRGDILFLNNQNDPIRVGEVVVFKIKDRDIPIVHRVLKVRSQPGHESASPLPGCERRLSAHPTPSSATPGTRETERRN